MSNISPELIIKEDLKNFNKILENMLQKGSNLWILSKNKISTDEIYNHLTNKLNHNTVQNERLFVYEIEKIESYIADVMLEPFDKAFSKLSDQRSRKKNHINRILLIKDLSDLDLRELNLLEKLSKYIYSSFNSTIIFSEEKMNLTTDPNQLFELYKNSIKWRPGGDSKNLSEQNLKITSEPENKNKTPRLKRKVRFFDNKFIFITLLSLLLIFCLTIFVREKNINSREKLLDYLSVSQKKITTKVDKAVNFFSSLVGDRGLKNINFNNEDLTKDIGHFEPQFSNGYVVQFYAHFKISEIYNWIKKNQSVQNYSIVKVEKFDDKVYYILISNVFKDYDQASSFISEIKFQDRHFIRSVESIQNIDKPKLDKMDRMLNDI